MADDNMFFGASAQGFDNAKRLRNDETSAEWLLWQHLRNRNVNGWKFRRQHPLGRFVVDFYCAELKLAIELDGSVHLDPEVKANDKARTEDLRLMGVTVLRFRNEEVLSNVFDVIGKIKNWRKDSI